MSFTLCFLLSRLIVSSRRVRLADSKPGVSPEAGPSQTVFLACTRNPPFAVYPKPGSSRGTQNPNLDFGPNSASCRDPKSDCSRSTRNPVLLVLPKAPSPLATQNPPQLLGPKSDSSPVLKTLVFSRDPKPDACRRHEVPKSHAHAHRLGGLFYSCQSCPFDRLS